jgi:hypothetical protein
MIFVPFYEGSKVYSTGEVQNFEAKPEWAVLNELCVQVSDVFKGAVDSFKSAVCEFLLGLLCVFLCSNIFLE